MRMGDLGLRIVCFEAVDPASSLTAPWQAADKGWLTSPYRESKIHKPMAMAHIKKLIRLRDF